VDVERRVCRTETSSMHICKPYRVHVRKLMAFKVSPQKLGKIGRIVICHRLLSNGSGAIAVG
jgi:hypothetical protein